MGEILHIKNYEKLANAIIIKAAKDYRSALKTLLKYPDDKKALQTKNETERFFKSQWFQALTKAPGEHIMKRIKEDVMKNDSKRILKTRI